MQITRPKENGPLDILTPLVVTNDSNQIYKQHLNNHEFDPLEFENQNDSPYELVERATLNELDELRSVLQPESQNTSVASKIIKSAPETSNDKEDFELSSAFFKEPVTVPSMNTVNKDHGTAHIISVDNAVGSYSENQTYGTENFTDIPSQPSKGTLNWRDFGSHSAQNAANPFVHVNPFHEHFHSVGDSHEPSINQQNYHLLSKTPPPSTEMNASIYCTDNDEADNYEYIAPLQRAKSLPNLQEQINVDNVNNDINKPMNSLTNSPEQQSQQHAPVATDRIENIMKQFQFQRMTQTSSSNQPPSPQTSMTMTNANSHNLYDMPPSIEANNSVNYVPPYSPLANTQTSQHSSINSYQPAYSSSISQTYPSNQDFNTGPIVVQSRPTQPNGSFNLNTQHENVISLNPTPRQPFPTSSNALPPINNTGRIYSVPSFGSTSMPIPQSFNLTQQPIDTMIQSNSPPVLPPRRPSSTKLDVSIFLM